MSNLTMMSAQLNVQSNAPLSPSHSQVVERMKVLYQADHQERFLSLQAETETLLHQLQEHKAQRLETPVTDVYSTAG
jgi:hypothetical protein